VFATSISARVAEQIVTRIARVRGPILARVASRSRQKVSSSTSANTGIAPYARGAMAVADIVVGDTMTSSPGVIPIAPIAATIRTCLN